MAIAKTNASLYNVEQEEKKDEFSLNMTPYALETTKSVKGFVHGNGVIIAFFQMDGTNSHILISTDDGTTFRTVEMDFVISDIIYSENLSKFIAVGSKTDSEATTRMKQAKCLETSEDGLTWQAEDWGDFIDDNTNDNYYGCIRESGAGFYLIGYTTYDYDNTSHRFILYSAFIEKGNDGTLTYSKVTKLDNIYSQGYYVDFASNFNVITKGNERTISNIGTRRILQTGETLSVTGYDYKVPQFFFDGYFILISGNNITKSINGIDYTTISKSAYTLKQICKHNGYYYCFAESKVCRVKNLADLSNIDSSEYLDTGFCTNTAVATFDDYMLLCTDGFIFKTTIDAPKIDETTLTVETLSATESLKQSKEYTDEQVAALVARIEALEGTTTE